MTILFLIIGITGFILFFKLIDFFEKI